MHKLKPGLIPVKDWWWVRKGRKDDFPIYHRDWTYFRHPKGRRQWVSQREIDLLDEDGYACAPRVRDRDKLPDAYDDLSHSRGYYIKCWKDYSRKRKSWM